MNIGGPACSVLAAAIALGAASMIVASPIEGSFRLVEQRYEDGEWNLADPARPLRLEFRRAGDLPQRRVWAGAEEEGASPWPAYASDAGPLPLEGVVVEEDAEAGGIRARYSVRPSPQEDLVLEIRETYHLAEGGNALLGSIEVRFTGGDANRGGFTLHRRFEREP